MESHIADLLRGQDPEDLATKVAVHYSTVQRWINGEALPWRRLLPPISVATGIPLEELRRARAADRAARKTA